MKKQVKIGILVRLITVSQIAYYLPYAAGLLESYFKKYVKNKEKYTFLEPLFKEWCKECHQHLFQSNDIVGFSLYSWNEQISLLIAKKLKAINKNIKIILVVPRCQIMQRSF